MGYSFLRITSLFNVRFRVLRQFSTDRTISEYAKAMLRLSDVWPRISSEAGRLSMALQNRVISRV